MYGSLLLGVFSKSGVVVVDFVSFGVEDNIFKDGIVVNSVVNIGFFFG